MEELSSVYLQKKCGLEKLSSGYYFFFFFFVMEDE